MNISLFTPLILEQQSVLPFLENQNERLLNGHLYIQGDFQGKHHTFHISLVVTGSNNSLISNVAEKAIAQFQPQMVFLLGIAGGVKDVNIGDLVVGTKAYGYESGKAKDSGFFVRPQVFPASQDLISLAHLVAHQNQWQKKIKVPHTNPKVIFGPIASGDKVIATTESPVYQLLKNSYNDTAALEMEAFGFGQTLHQHQNIRWLNVRGISDLLNNKNAADDANHQPLAAATAAAFVFEMLYEFDASQFNLPIMDVKTLTGFLVTTLVPFLKKSKSIETITKDISAASNTTLSNIWKKVKPLFIEEFEEEKGELSEDAEDEGAVTHVLKKKLRKDEELKDILEALVKEQKANTPPHSTVVTNNKSTMTGGTNSAGRDIHFGDVNKNTSRHIEQQINNSGRIGKQYNIPNHHGTIQISDTIHIYQVLSESPLSISSKSRQYGIETIHQLIGANKIKSALEELLRLSKSMDSDIQNQAIMLTSRWNRIRAEKFAGTITNEQVNIQQNRVLGGILGILEEFV